MTRSFCRLRSAWTLLEAMIVIALLGTLLSLLVVRVAAARENANRLTCQARLKELALAVHLYHETHGVMPPYASGRGDEIVGSWLLHLLPYVGHAPLHEQIMAEHRSRSPDFWLISGTHASANGTMFRELICPSDPSHILAQEPTINYLANWYAFSDEEPGAYRPPQPFRVLTDGLSNVVLFAEGYGDCAGVPRLALASFPYHNFGLTPDALPSDDPSYAPQDFTHFQIKPRECDSWRTQTAHSAMPVALADGSARFLSSSIDSQTWKRILKPRDGNPNSDW